MRNRQFNILEIIAITLVVLGHLGDIPILNQIFPTYGYHMALFLFISGYFFKDLTFKQYPYYIWTRIKKLILPLLGWNIVYAFIAHSLYKRQATDYFASMSDCFSFYNLFISPFKNGDQYILNLASWFVVCLVVTQLTYGIIHCCKNKTPDWLILAILLIAGMVTTGNPDLSNNSVWESNLYRTLFALPFFHLGYCHRKYIEKNLNKLPIYFYFPIVLLGIYLFYYFGMNQQPYSYILVYNNYGSSCWKPFVSSTLGILLWIGIAKEIAKYIVPSKLEDYIAQNTWSIMIHHLTVMFCLNWLAVKYCTPCDADAFRSSFWGMQPCFPLWLYASLMIILPLVFQYVFDRIKQPILYLTDRLLNKLTINLKI